MTKCTECGENIVSFSARDWRVKKGKPVFGLCAKCYVRLKARGWR